MVKIIYIPLSATRRGGGYATTEAIMPNKRSRAELAHELFPHIVEFALRKELTGYVPLAEQIGHPHFVMQSALGPIMFLCEQRVGWPALTAIVVNRHGVPGVGFDDRGKSIPELQREVFDFDWTAIGVPTVAEFQDALDRAHNHNKSAVEWTRDHGSSENNADEDGVGHINFAQDRRMIVDAVNRGQHIKVLKSDNPFRADRKRRYQFLFSYDGKTVWSYIADNGPVGTLIRAVHDGRVVIV
jgi:hypothetical protein